MDTCKAKMEVKELQMPYSELKEIYKEVIAVTGEYAGSGSVKLTRSTRLGNDLGMYELDTLVFMERFSDKFAVDFSKWEYGDYYAPPVGCIFLILLPLIVFYSLLKLVLACLTLLISKSISERIQHSYIPILDGLREKDISLGDLVVSITQRQFVEEKCFKITLKM